MTDDEMISQRGISQRLGVTLQAAKKWRGATIAALRKAGQLNRVDPDVKLPTGALPLPDNQREHVLHGEAPRWRPATIDAWAERTHRAKQPDRQLVA